MRAFSVVCLAVAALLALPTSARPFPSLSPDASGFALDNRPLEVLPNHIQAVPHIQEHDAHRALGRTAHAPLRMQHHEARELARIVVRALKEGEGLITRKFEELEKRHMSKSTKKKIEEVLDKLEGRSVSFFWEANWKGGHNSNTSQLGGYKPGSRMDSTSPPQYHVGLFETSGKQIVGSPIIQASFDEEPTSMEEILPALRKALSEA